MPFFSKKPSPCPELHCPELHCPELHCPELPELFTEFVNNNLSKLLASTDREEVKKGLILQLFGGAFPELTNFIVEKKNGLINEYNLMKDLDATIKFSVEHNLEKKGGSKKNKQVHKKKSRKTKKSKKLN